MLRLLQFLVRIGSSSNLTDCLLPTSRSESVIVDYSNDYGTSWHNLKWLHPMSFTDKAQKVQIELPVTAQGNATIIKWWQPLIGLGMNSGKNP